MRRLVGTALLAVAVGLGALSPGIPSSEPTSPTAQAPAGGPGESRVMTFTWTLYPRMWAELDLRMVAPAEAVAAIQVERGEGPVRLRIELRLTGDARLEAIKP